MGGLICRIRSFNFKGIVFILLIFLLIAAILFVELSGVNALLHKRQLELLPDYAIVTKAKANESLEKNTLLLRNSEDRSSNLAYEQFVYILDDMKVGYYDVDVSKDTIPSFEEYREVIVLLSDLTPMGDTLKTLTDWVKAGGAVYMPLTLEGNVFTDSIFQKIGIDDASPNYYVVESIYIYDEFMIGGGSAFILSNPFDCARTVALSKNAEIFAAAQTPDGVPLVWRNRYGDGVFVVVNIGIYEKALRGFYAAAYSLLSDTCAYPVINASVFYLDDFPSQIPSGNSEYILRDYNTTIRDFYVNIWWPDMLNFADAYGLKYTGLAIESYDDNTDGTLEAKPDTGTFLNFGNMLLRKGGELGYHGYNHQPLCLGDSDYKNRYPYKTWESSQAMKTAFDALVELCNELFSTTEFILYVPPSNLLSEKGREFLLTNYPYIKTISGIYFDDDEYSELDFICTQEFDVNEDGVVDQPRIISGFILGEFQSIAAISELNMHFVNSHFTHPDDALDEERGADLGWEEMKKRFNNYLSWLYTSAPTLRNMTGTEASAAVQRYIAAVPHTVTTEDSVVITIDNFYDEAQLLVRFNTGTPIDVKGGTLTHMTGDLYLLSASQSVVNITLD